MDRYVDLRPLDSFIKDLSALWWYYFFLGLILVLWGVAIIVWPQLLVAFVAALFVVAGSTLVGLSWRVWRLQRRYQSFKHDLIGV